MSKHDHPLHVECPACHHEFDVEQSLSQQIEKRLRADYEKDRTKAQQELDQEREKLAKEKEALHKREQAIQDQVNERVKAERAAIEAKALKEAEAAKQEELEQLRKKAEDQRKALSDLKKEQLELMDEKEKLQNMKADLELENKRTLAKERQRIEEEVRKREEEEFRMKLREKEVAMEQLKVKLEEATRRAEQGSMQVQGEAQELELFDLLNELFRMDEVQEVAKGANGADVLHVVHDRLGRPQGTVAYESKRTKAFSDRWVDKLKEDMQRHKAEIGVIVTEAMPKDMPTMGMRNGVFVCSFAEVRGLALVLRRTVLRVAEVRTQEENKEEKAHQMYAFLTSPEFKQRMQVLLEGYATMKEQLEKEKRSMTRQWAAREKQLDALVTSASELQGAIMGISGKALEAIEEHETHEELEG
ncbi:MAG: DUF2130 domain-containing protein [Flavobacteriales bacterium]|nr:DUF2130 domain-containing protein [Flavobacteriales bacterium]